MNENDIIAEYVKERYPELLTAIEFTFYKLGCALKNVVSSVVETAKRIDLGELVKAMKECEEAEEEPQETWKQQTMSRFERVE